jgi:hypothetical protein
VKYSRALEWYLLSSQPPATFALNLVLRVSLQHHVLQLLFQQGFWIEIHHARFQALLAVRILTQLRPASADEPFGI